MRGVDPNASRTFLTHPARVLIAIACDPTIRFREMAAACEVTERTARAIVADLEACEHFTHSGRAPQSASDHRGRAFTSPHRSRP
jgi:hypothetical protein